MNRLSMENERRSIGLEIISLKWESSPFPSATANQRQTPTGKETCRATREVALIREEK